MKKLGKKILAVSLVLSMVLGQAVTVMAEEVTDATETTEATTAATEDTTEATTAATEATTAAPTETVDSTTATTEVATATGYDVYVAFGADLSADQKNTVMGIFGITEDQLSGYKIGSITNSEEHQYLDSYLGQSVIGTKALSSVMVTKKEKGSGITVATTNISYCTVGMYTNALITAGMEDAEVKVAGPFAISGTAALVGAMKAYAEMTGEAVSEEAIDAAVNEIVVTGQIAENIGDSEKVEELFAYVKAKMVEEGWDDPAKIREALDEACKEMDITLTDEEKDQIVDLMTKISGLDLDIDSIKAQASDLYDKVMALDIDTSGIGEFFSNIIDAIVDFFKGLFG